MKRYKIDIYTYPKETKKAINKIYRAGKILSKLYKYMEKAGRLIDAKIIEDLLNQTIDTLNCFENKQKSNKIL